MSHYVYKAKVQPYQCKEGTIEARDQKDAVGKIIKMGYIPIEVFMQRNVVQNAFLSTTTESFCVQGIHSKDKVFFLKQFRNLMEAQIPLLKALQLMMGQAKNPYFKEFLMRISRSVEDGASVSLALCDYSKIFPSYMTAMINVGEVSGNLNAVLERLLVIVQKEEETVRKIKMVLIYPLIILTVGFLTIFVLLTFVIPKLSVMFEDLGQNLPLMTRILLSLSDHLSYLWWILIVFFLGLGIALRKMYLQPQGKMKIDRLLIKTPLLGDFIRNQDSERFLRVLGILLNSGIDILRALECAKEVMNNEVLKLELTKVTQNVAQGSGLAAAFRSRKFLSIEMITMIAIAEESSRLDEALLKLAQNLEEESEKTLKIAMTLIEPMLILLIGGLVGFIVIALLLPIFEMNMLTM